MVLCALFILRQLRICENSWNVLDLIAAANVVKQKGQEPASFFQILTAVNFPVSPAMWAR